MKIAKITSYGNLRIPSHVPGIILEIGGIDARGGNNNKYILTTHSIPPVRVLYCAHSEESNYISSIIVTKCIVIS